MPQKEGKKGGGQQQKKQPASRQPVRTNEDETTISGIPGDRPRPRARKRRSSTLLRDGQPSGPTSESHGGVGGVSQAPRFKLSGPKPPVSIASRLKIHPPKLSERVRKQTPSPPESSARSSINIGLSIGPPSTLPSSFVSFLEPPPRPPSQLFMETGPGTQAARN